MCPNTTKYKKKQSILPCCHDFDEVLPQETPVAPRMAQGNIKIISEKKKKLRAWLRETKKRAPSKSSQESSVRGCGKKRDQKKRLLA
jgi:hypothetical protein